MGIILPSIPIDFQTFLYILLVIGGLSGWLALWLDRLSERPRIKGKILQVMKGMTNENNPAQRHTSFTVFLYLTNTSKNPIHVIDYTMEIEIERGFPFRHRFRPLLRVLGVPEQGFHFEDPQGQEIGIPDIENLLKVLQSRPIEFGTPLYGLVLFFGNISYYAQNVRTFRLRCKDVFGREHRVSSKRGDWYDLSRLRDLYHMRVERGNP